MENYEDLKFEEDLWMKQGGPAFPIDIGTASYRGMTLRDYFAGQALIRIAASDNELTAKACYRLADAMLKEREKT